MEAESLYASELNLSQPRRAPRDGPEKPLHHGVHKRATPLRVRVGVCPRVCE